MLQIQSGRSFKEFSTFGIGGPIGSFAEVRSIEEMEEAFQVSRDRKIPIFILGKGSNCLFDDKGFEGLVLLNKIDFCMIDSQKIDVGSGYSFSLLGVQSARKGLSGLEFASGIPGTVGGAVYMNAGANGRETSESLESVLFLTLEGEKITFWKKDLQFSYRHSPFQNMRGAILSAQFSLTLSNQARADQLKIVDYRLKTQPYKDKSAGCIFCNPSRAVTAGHLIDQCGLKGLQVGGAKVSEMHANFIVNANQATAEDVLELIRVVQKTVEEKTGYRLEPEVRVVKYE